MIRDFTRGPCSTGSATRRDIVPPMPSRDTGSFLRRSSIFAALPAREIEALAAVAVEETHRTRDYIFR